MKTFTNAFFVLMMLLISCNKANVDEITNMTDNEFAVKSSSVNKFEIQTGELALTRSADSAIVNLGDMLRTNHQEAQTQLVAIAAILNISLPDTLDN
ncbi:hypothetical protein BH11BAC4_BH11BAC4_13660 [soil metagenome]